MKFPESATLPKEKATLIAKEDAAIKDIKALYKKKLENLGPSEGEQRSALITEKYESFNAIHKKYAG